MRVSIALFLLLGCAALGGSGWAEDLALVGGRIYVSPVEAPIEGGTVLVRDGRIAAVGPRATITVPAGAAAIDCQGRVVTAGFWNSHVHVFTAGLLDAEKLSAEQLSSQLDQMLTRWGFTSVFDTASPLDNTNLIRRRIASGEVRGPRILTVGDPFYPKGGTPVYVKAFLAAHHVPNEEVASAEEAAARARGQLARGADGVKIFAASFAAGGILPMPVEVAKAIVAEAHRAGKPAFAHPSNLEGIEIAIASRVDVLAHTAPLAGAWPLALINRMKAGQMALVPTLTLFEVEGKKFGEPPAETVKIVGQAVEQLRTYAAAGGQILFGTDVGYTDHYDTAEEFTLMARAGMDFQQILASLTTNPAARFKAARSGRIAPGMDADLVVLDADPAREVTAFSRVRATIRGGKVLYSR